jgi:competence protein ComEA
LAADAKDAKKDAVIKETSAKTSKKATAGKPAPKQKNVKKAAKKKAPPKPLNINTASAKELQQLTGVGPKTAKAIVDYRKKHGKFKKTEDLMKVKGVDKKTFGKNKSHIKTK